MEVLYGEGLTSHLGPESCVGTGNGLDEALTGGAASRVIEPRKAECPRCLRSRLVRGTTSVRPIEVRSYRTWRGRRAAARVQAFCTEPGRSQIRPYGDGHAVRSANPEGARR